jgi:hypothetical protein
MLARHGCACFIQVVAFSNRDLWLIPLAISDRALRGVLDESVGKAIPFGDSAKKAVYDAGESISNDANLSYLTCCYEDLLL